MGAADQFHVGFGAFRSAGEADLCGVKMAIWDFPSSDARAMGRYGVTVNSVAPGAATRMMDTVPADRSAEGSGQASSEAARD